MADLTKRSILIDRIKSWIYAGADGVEIPMDMSLVERFLMLKYMSAMSKNMINLNTHNYYTMGRKVENFTAAYLNSLFLQANKLDPELKSLITNLKSLTTKLQQDDMDILPQNSTNWGRLLTKISYVTSINGDVWNDTLKEQTMLAAIGLSLLEAEMRDYSYSSKLFSHDVSRINENQIRAIDSLLLFSQTEPVFNIIQHFFGITNTRDIVVPHALNAYIDIYQAKVDFYADALQKISIDPSAEPLDVDTTKAYYSDYKALVRLLKCVIETGNINERDSYKNTLLHRACYEKDTELAKLVIHLGVDLTIMNTYDCTADYYAFNFSTPDILELLLEKNATVLENRRFIDHLKKAVLDNPEYASVLNKYFPDLDAATLIQDTFGI